MAAEKKTARTDGVDYPVAVCPGCNTTDNQVVQNGGTGSTKADYRIRRCRQCGMRFKEHVPEAAKKS